MYFEETVKLSNIYQWKEVAGKPEKFYQHFVTSHDDIVYVCEGEQLKGVVSMGDLYRYYNGTKTEFVLNTKFASLKEVNFEKAIPIFEKFGQINEVPVVENGLLIGAVKNGHKRNEQVWKKLCDNLAIQIRQWDKSKFIAKEIKRWKSKVEDIDLLIYSNLGDIRNFIEKNLQSDLSKKYCLLNSIDFDKHRYGKANGFCFEFENINFNQKNGFYVINDYCSKKLNIKGGHRVTPNSRKMPHKIFVFGPCTAFGAYVDDYHTIEYFLQKKINYEKCLYDVVNCGLLGPDYSYCGFFYEKMAPGDKVVVLISDGKAPLIQELKDDYKGNLTEIFEEIENPISCWLDSPAHCNGEVNQKISDYIWKDLQLCLEKEPKISIAAERVALQDYYIAYEVYTYFDEYLQKYQLTYEIKREGKKGAVVVNCNPFTLGHR